MKLKLAFIMAGLLLGCASTGPAKGPEDDRNALIKLYQQRVSSIGGPDRCGFRPSCSNYGYEAIKEQGPVIGLVMIGDRQTRCNIFKEPGPDYALLPNGKLYDPISKNLLFEK